MGNRSEADLDADRWASTREAINSQNPLFGGGLRAHWAWLLLIALGFLSAGVVAVLPIDSLEWLIFGLTVEALTVTIMVVMAVRLPKGNASKAVWWGFIGCQAFTFAGDVVYNYQVYFLGLDPDLGWADVFWLLSYVFAIGGLVLLIRRLGSGRNEEAWIDALILALGGTAFVLVFVLGHSVQSDSLNLEEAVSVLYPLSDILVLSALIRVMFAGGRRNLSTMLVATGFAGYAIADLMYNIISVHEALSWFPVQWMEALFTLSACILAAAILAPGADRLTEAGGELRERDSSRRMVGLAAGGVGVPALLIYAVWQEFPGLIVRALSITLLVMVILVLWRVRGLLRTVEEQADLLKEQARTDPLTGLPNRRTLDFQLARLIRDDGPLTLAMLDIDHFKAYNDTRGHQAADDLLRAVALSWSRIFDAPFFFARYGGEEFTAVLPGISVSEAELLLDRARLEMPDGQTVSIGFAVRRSGERVSDTLRRADAAMYAAKRNGRNRVEFYDDVMDPHTMIDADAP